MSYDDNLILLTDSYKVTHWRQYPPETERVYSYFESRGGRFPEVVFFGLQHILERHLAGVVVSAEAIDEAESTCAAHFGDPTLFNRPAWEHILREHGGRLPVSIRAVAEGTVVPTREVMMTIENTDPRCYWLTNYLETLLVQVWYTSTVATLSREIRRVIARYLEETGDPELIESRLHDFGFRGSTSVESAAIGGAAHLVSFSGTDNLAACMLVRKLYNEPMAGLSIPASEHSTITAWGREGEVDAFRNMLERYPSGLVACVSDSYDIFHACKALWGGALRERVLARDGTLIVRPDSGDPTETVLEVVVRLGDAFGSETNEKGYRLLPPQVRVIQGDGVDLETIDAILARLKGAGWSADNIAFGMGGALLQKLHRDTQQFAFKCAEVRVAGEDRPVYKDPVTDPGKRSKRGRLALERGQDGRLHTVPGGRGQNERDERGERDEGGEPGGGDLLTEVFRDGEIRVRHDFQAIRERAALTSSLPPRHPVP